MKLLHILGHVGLGAIQVINVAAPFVPPPWGLAVGAGAAFASLALAAHGHAVAAKEAVAAANQKAVKEAEAALQAAAANVHQ